MGLREWMNENSAIVTVGAVVLLVVALTIVIMQGTGGGVVTTDQAYYYDAEADNIFTAPIESIPPIESPAGNQAVRVHYYSCGGCGEEERFVGYYEKYTEEAKQAIQEARTAGSEGGPQGPARMQAMMTGQLYSADGEEWYPAMSPRGTQVQAELANRCGEGEKLRICVP